MDWLSATDVEFINAFENVRNDVLRKNECSNRRLLFVGFFDCIFRDSLEQSLWYC